MKDYKERFIKKYCTIYGIPVFVNGVLNREYSLLNTNNGDEILNFIEQIISERDKEWGETLKKERELWEKITNIK